MEYEKLWFDFKENNCELSKKNLIINHIEIVNKSVNSLYYKYKNYFEYEDLLGYGSLGLIDAIEKFNYKKGIKFKTYAYLRVRGTIIDEIRAFNWVPRGVQSRNKRYNKAIEFLQQKYGDSYTNKDIADKLDMDLDEFFKFQKESTIYSVYSLDVKRNSLENRYSNKPEKELCDKEEVRLLSIGIRNLEKRERKIVELYFYSELTYAEISEIMGISAPRISQLMKKILFKLREYLERDFLIEIRSLNA